MIIRRIGFVVRPLRSQVWQGRDAIKTGRKLLGETNPAASLPGTVHRARTV